MTLGPDRPLQRVLIIEDSAEDALLLEWALQEVAPEVEVQAVSDSPSAIRCVHSPDSPDLVVLDLHLLHQTALDVLVELKRLEGPPVRVVCWSSHAHPQEAAAVLAAGALACVDKPLGMPGFLQLAQTLLRLTSQTMPSPE